MTPLQVTYELGLDDLHAVTMHHLSVSPHLRRRMWLAIWACWILGLVLIAVVARNHPRGDFGPWVGSLWASDIPCSFGTTITADGGARLRCSWPRGETWL